MDMFVFVMISQMDENVEVLPVMFVTAWLQFLEKPDVESMWLLYRQSRMPHRLLSHILIGVSKSYYN